MERQVPVLAGGVLVLLDWKARGFQRLDVTSDRALGLAGLLGESRNGGSSIGSQGSEDRPLADQFSVASRHESPRLVAADSNPGLKPSHSDRRRSCGV